MQTRAQLKEKAKKQLQNKWQDAVIFTLVIFLISVPITQMSQSSSFLGSLASLVGILITGPLVYAMTKYFYGISQGKKVELALIKEGFAKFAETTMLYLWMTLKVILWSLLFIIPGIIAGFRYSQAFFILNENPTMKPDDILKKSSKMMEGHKMRLFVLQLSFIGWGILAVLTFGIGTLWLVPYMQTTLANFYEDLKWEGKLTAVKEVKKEIIKNVIGDKIEKKA